jgi:NAD(P)-dependent dehydrogenase (short-subunit alcohol dehydrogenase family)
MRQAASGAWAAVTGGSGGIGRAVCAALAERGVNVVLLYHERRDAACEAVLSLRARGVSAEVAPLDVTDGGHVSSVLADRPFDILVNCAGITVDRTIARLTPTDWAQVLDVNLKGTYLCSQAVLPGMRHRGYGRIVNVASIIGQTGNFGQGAYSASKAGVIGLTKTLALETADKDITVNAVCPGFIDTDMLRSIPQPALDRIAERIPKKRFGCPEEVASAVGFLVERRAAYITGQQLNVNGGMYL